MVGHCVPQRLHTTLSRSIYYLRWYGVWWTMKARVINGRNSAWPESIFCKCYKGEPCTDVRVAVMFRQVSAEHRLRLSPVINHTLPFFSEDVHVLKNEQQ